EVLKALRKLADETIEEEADKDPMARKVHEAFKAKVGAWGTVSEGAYYNAIG
ncbi:MAG: hypothetical protein JG766_1580, partial [Desulfacinum sp.]|nr:hypothetical protein [Desulfacinum sp.]